MMLKSSFCDMYERYSSLPSVLIEHTNQMHAVTDTLKETLSHNSNVKCTLSYQPVICLLILFWLYL